MKICRYYVFISAFYKIPRPLILGASNTGIEILSCLILMRAFLIDTTNFIAFLVPKKLLGLVLMQFALLANNC